MKGDSTAKPAPTLRAAVLFVDDEPAILAGFSDALRKEPYEILTATSAALALDVLSRAHVDVVVSDECMPRMCGSAFLERVHRDYPNIVRIMLTGEASLAASVRAINDGLYRFLGKPVRPEELSRVIRDALKMKSLGADATKRR
jgi:DNA-binding NtrC family response regulator